MIETITLSVDAMGGDNAPRAVIHGADLLLKEHNNARFIFHGRQEQIDPLLNEFPALKSASSVRHCETVIAMDEKPSQALRKGRGTSSMWMTIQAVKDGEASVAVSGGNTGALMAMATFCLRPMEGIARPGIAAIWPTLRKDIVVLDMGATIGADAQQLVDYAILGSALARCLFDDESPTVGLLNVGTEEVKGLESIKEAGRILSDASGSGFTYHGFVEGDDIGKGTVDVVVTEGFVGNIALKTAEGTARQVGSYLRTALKSNLMSRIGALFATSALNALRKRMDPRTVNGGVFMGLNGIVIKSHGGTDEVGYKSALNLAYGMARSNLVAKIDETMKRFPIKAAPVAADAESEAKPA
ncbi:phosphate acyltransferase PlsX [Devosia sp. J2-20]|jgi:phosphate acyltransferase|uniref:Phosphate acyltransferase n=1 Tax=Devosia litorisediminis TaxID=2829817 RepID=A0A942EAJ9_9HYPH|nr:MULTISPECIES: phosphate acyltransferase PlsX [Devosia]MBS3848864.1 phosphate acyltransferase PlsX [Devosia litorisediminis]MCZ4346150.1 phosphate acyltransferase PlsX [Devosia neptuniae]WDQ98054.1 phosphate acyltransferase PlsX [Devosia sp. J2-20]|tara:strand:- start:72412 stop:73482 length:1071 start_codon:yes stop_codon:yes gene_type:complete